jgi:hypothetical protein
MRNKAASAQCTIIPPEQVWQLMLPSFSRNKARLPQAGQ